MSGSINFVHRKDDAIQKVREILNNNNAENVTENESGGYGIKFSWGNAKPSSLVLYYNGKGDSTKIVFEKSTDEIIKWFTSIAPLQGKIPKFDTRIGTDESGKGDYFGPLVVAGVFADRNIEEKLIAIGVCDSKKNTFKQNQRMAEEIKTALKPEQYSVIYISNEKYNELYAKLNNLNTLLAWGHARVIENLLEKNKCENIIADQFGNERYIKDALLERGRGANLFQTPRAESDTAVAAASILARDTYVRLMENLCELYGLDLPKGASGAVDEAARIAVKEKGADFLRKVAKLHFKTTQKVIC
ncbi:MAG: ribonuclease HIII [Clostridiales bacterium]|jgi:ribonuclease HIII|nr:ribonuclease HIII [Clostridiales bacterium]